jgi:hypothetical protein
MDFTLIFRFNEVAAKLESSARNNQCEKEQMSASSGFDVRENHTCDAEPTTAGTTPVSPSNRSPLSSLIATRTATHSADASLVSSGGTCENEHCDCQSRSAPPQRLEFVQASLLQLKSSFEFFVMGMLAYVSVLALLILSLFVDLFELFYLFY